MADATEATQPACEVCVEIQFGTVVLQRDELACVQPASLIPLRENEADPIRVVADGRIVAEGTAIVVDGKLAVEITRLVGTGPTICEEEQAVA